MPKILWLDDGFLLEHPIAKLAIHDLLKKGYQVNLKSRDLNEEKAFFTSFVNEEAMSNYLIRRKQRKRNLERLSSSKIGKIICVKTLAALIARFLNNYDKKVSRYFTYTLPRQKSFINAFRKFVFSRNKFNVLILSRAYLFWFILFNRVVLKCFWIRSNYKIIYYPYEIYGHQRMVKGKKATKFLERMFLRFNVDLLITQNIMRKDYYISIGYKAPFLIIENFKKYKEIELKIQTKGDQEIVDLVFVGLVDVGRDLEQILKWNLIENANIRISIVGKVHKRWNMSNQDLIERSIKEHKLRIYQPLEDNELPQFLQQFDVGVITYDSECLNHLYCAPSKLTDYLHAGLPIVSSNLPAMQRFSEELEFIRLLHQSSYEEYKRTLESLRPYFSLKGKEKIMRETSCYDWNIEFVKFEKAIREMSDQTSKKL